MNEDHEIYRAREDEIPSEDAARLDGYLAGKAEEHDAVRFEREKAAMLKRFEEMEAKLRKAEEAGRS